MFAKLNQFEENALLFAEKYGIFNYTVEAEEMIYFESYPNEGRTMHIVDLNTMDEYVTVVEASCWNPNL